MNSRQRRQQAADEHNYALWLLNNTRNQERPEEIERRMQQRAKARNRAGMSRVAALCLISALPAFGVRKDA